MHNAVHAFELANVTTNNIRWNNAANELHHAVCDPT
jgi:hypothetical protein